MKNVKNMQVRRRTAVVALGATVLATGAGAAAAAATPGPAATRTAAATATATPGPKQDPKQDPNQNPGQDPKQDPKQDPNQTPDLAAVAKDLGVTVDQLDTALRTAKQWAVSSGATGLTPQTFAAHVAAALNEPADRVLAAFEAHGLFPDPGKPGSKGKDGKGGKPGPGNRPINLDKAAAALGVTRAQLEEAFVQTKEWIGTSGTKPTPAAFAAHVSQVLGKPADTPAVVLKVLVADGVLALDPATPKQG